MPGHGRSPVVVVCMRCELCVLCAGGALCLPAFHPGTQVQLMRPRVARLLVQHPVGIGDMVGIDDAVLGLGRVAVREVFANPLGVDGGIDHQVRDVDVLWPQFARHALRQRPQRVLGAGKRGHVLAPAQAGGGAGKEDRAPLARQHRARGLAAHQEAAEARHLPDLVVHARAGLGDGKLHVGADIEDRHLQRRDLALDARDQLDGLVFLARIAAKGMGFAAIGADLLHQRLQLVGMAARYAGNVALAGKAPCNGAAGGVASPDDEDGLLFGHGCLLAWCPAWRARGSRSMILTAMAQARRSRPQHLFACRRFLPQACHQPVGADRRRAFAQRDDAYRWQLDWDLHLQHLQAAFLLQRQCDRFRHEGRRPTLADEGGLCQVRGGFDHVLRRVQAVTEEGLFDLHPQRGPRRRQHARHGGEVGPAGPGLACQLVAAPHHDHHRLFIKRLGQQVRRGIAWLQPAHDQVELAQAQLGQQVGQVAFFHQHGGVRVALLERAYGLGQQHRQCRTHRAYADAPGSAALYRGNLVAGLLVLRQHRARKAHQRLAGGRRLGAARGAREQCQSQHLLDFGQHLGHCRLAYRQELRGAPEMAELVERHQQLQVAQLDIGAQRAVDLYHARSLANHKVMKQCQLAIGLL
ncbi:hypothetical protein CBM2625_B110181 [Cupriavidus taiwanensis]|nr:hypothetical protein CBM2625_B110181 [Cupriavidus taiwanensis]